MWLIIVFLALGLTVLLWIGTLFLQSYIYTVPTEGIAWQAPAAGAALALFFGLWCAMVASHGTPNDLVYDTIVRFSPKVEMVKEPVKELFAVYQKGGGKERYVLKKDDYGRAFYQQDNVKPRPWSGSGIAAIHLIHNGESFVFEAVPGKEGGYRTFVEKNSGWTIPEFEKGPTGIPTRFVLSRFLANLFLNFFHLSLWFICLWLLLRFQWSHALGLALCMWVLVTLAILPMLLGYAAALNEPGA